ncbi:MAG: helix-turn-helix domain-containing protein [Methanosarcinales archaeon]|nr:helix-turn-helix domain-containing protein [Methanosarcinales archaeon]
MIKNSSHQMDKQLLSAFLALDLTHKEAQAYYALVIRGVMTAEDISKVIQVQHAIVYRTLEGLRNKGWIDSTTDRPKKYRAKQPKTAAESAGNVLVSKVNESVGMVSELLEPVYDDNQEMLRQELWTVRGLDNVIRKLQEMGERAKQGIFGKITGPIDDTTFNRLFKCTPLNVPVSVQIMGPPIVDMDTGLKKRIQVKRPNFEARCKNFPMVTPTAQSKEDFLKDVHGNRFIAIHLLFDEREAMWINIPYRDNVVIEEKVWANWIIDPEYIAIIKAEV